MAKLQDEPTEHFTKGHARRYMEAVYGDSVWFRAPETFNNVLERWMWGVACNVEDYAETQMAIIEQMVANMRNAEQKTQDEQEAKNNGH
jgi:hypothetical protein